MKFDEWSKTAVSATMLDAWNAGRQAQLVQLKALLGTNLGFADGKFYQNLGDVLKGL